MWLYFHYLDDPDADPDNQRQWEEDYPPWVFRDELERGEFLDPDRNVKYAVQWLMGSERALAFRTIGIADPALPHSEG